ncbi:MAG: aspartate-semialdehyde dehydrogenase [Persicimonas sp.]
MSGTTISQDGVDVAVVGATGAVGREMLDILEERAFPVRTLRVMASPRSAGKKLAFDGHQLEVEALTDASFEGVDIGLFSAGSSVSLEHAPRAVDQGAVVIDNTSAFRMDEDVPLVVPEVNAEEIRTGPGIIANPNCSTIQMVVALEPLRRAVGLERVVVSTYQSASGAGQKGVDELMASVRAYLEGGEEPEPNKFAHPLAFEALPHIDTFFDSGFTREELKMVRETRKIMDLQELDIAATCVRVPVIRSHSEAITVDLAAPLSVDKARRLFESAPGVRLLDDPEANAYPRARLAEKTDATWVGRIRRDLDREATLHFWCVSDNLRKGAALNSIQIAEYLVEK